MLRTTAIGLTALALILSALTPALADVPTCMKQPNADSCPTMGAPSKTPAQATPSRIRHTRYHAPQPTNKG